MDGMKVMQNLPLQPFNAEVTNYEQITVYAPTEIIQEVKLHGRFH